MCKRPRLRNNLIVLALLLAAPVACACSPNFPNSLIQDDSEVLASPPADFLYELEQIPLATRPTFKYIKRSTTEAEVQDLTAALHGAPDAQRTIDAYTKLRAQIDAYLAAQNGNDASQPLLAPKPLEVTIPSGLPEEFLRYIRGAIAYHNGKFTRAISLWKTVLDLPADQRRYRSTWATFMIARASMNEQPGEAIRFFEETRKLAQKGFFDSLGLAALSYGWEGRIALDRRQFNVASDRYLMQFACDDPLAAWSLRDVAARIIAGGPSDMNEAARDDQTRQAVTAFLLCEPSFRAWTNSFSAAPKTNQIVQWFAAIEAAKVRNLENCDRLAAIAYQMNLYTQADRWLLRGELTPLGHWVRAKLLLREGKLSSAAAHLAEAVRGFPHDLTLRPGDYDYPEEIVPALQIRGEMGAVHLAQKQYVAALTDLLNGGFWQDAAYVAERVLTADELMAYVDVHWPADKPGSDDIRSLLARRLMRLDRGDEAVPYFPKGLRDKAIEYHLALCDGRSTKRSASERAELLWKAATIARENGMELLGTELEPDCNLHGGNFNDWIVPARLGSKSPLSIAPTNDERDRAHQSAASPNVRFHYRYLAADIAWEAIALMKDNDPVAAERLCEAGGWLKAQSPKTADRFYKELVTRFAQTDLGIQAAKKHWFPK
jgi:hypothetical protein